MRAVVIGPAGEPGLTDVPEPEGEVVRVLACGLCGSDIEKLAAGAAGLVLGHEVVAETAEGRRVVLVHHRPCGECSRCRAGHESTCERFSEPTIVPGGFAERAEARGGWVELPDGLGDAVASYAEPLGCVLRAVERVPPGDVLVVGGGFVGRLFAAVLRRRGDSVHVFDADPERSDGEPPGHAPAVVLAARGAGTAALAHAAPGALVLAFADPGPVDGELVYRRELTVTGSRSAMPADVEAATALLPELDLPEPTVLPLERFAEGLDLYRRREVLKVVFAPRRVE